MIQRHHGRRRTAGLTGYIEPGTLFFHSARIPSCTVKAGSSGSESDTINVTLTDPTFQAFFPASPDQP